jgi:hypothetical protein
LANSGGVNAGPTNVKRARTLSSLGAVAVALAGAAALAAAAAGTGTGSIVVRLVTDPVRPGVDWSYAGVGNDFQLGTVGKVKTISGLDDQTYTLVEQAATGQPRTLTSLTCADPSGGTTVDVASGTASIDLSSGETITCTFAHRALGPRAAAAALGLAKQYAPVLRYATGEQYRPIRLEEYLRKTVLRTGTPPRGVLGQSQPTLYSLPVTPAQTYLDVSGAEPNANAARYPGIEQTIESARPRPTVYWHLARQPSSGRIALEYWFFYLYNNFYAKHESDWEGVTVFLKDGAALGATYSQHQGRKWVPWSSLATSGSHPLVFVGRGSHADYPAAGRYSVRVCWTLRGRRCAPAPKVDDANGGGSTLTSTAYDVQEFGGVGYTGSWGSGNYVLGVGLTSDRITDPRRRSEYTNPFAAAPP